MTTSQPPYRLLVIAALLLITCAFAMMQGCFSAPVTEYKGNKDSSSPSITPVSPKVFPRVIEGRIVGITDGDTVTVLTSDNQNFKIRLAGIDAPEKTQPFRDEAKQHLSSLIFDQEVKINATKLDKWQRIIGQIFFENKDINLEMIKVGLAWHFKQFAKEQTEADRQAYGDAESGARNQKIGIWSIPNPEPPWQKRHPSSL